MELYIHIPFCVRKCRYCDFASYSGADAEIAPYLDLLLTEARQVRPLVHSPLRSVYIGGGTPSLLSPAQLQKLLTGIREIFSWPSGIECTMEANPGTLSVPLLDAAAELGVNRLSIGMQAFQETLLSELGRIHRYPDVLCSVEAIRKAGIANFNLDLMFGLPGQTRRDWQETLQAAISLQPKHLSTYGLIPEEGTPMWEDLASGRIRLPDPDEEREMYYEARTQLRRAGFRQYEISNFSLPGFECAHNIGYWTQIPYLGLGLSAASMVSVQKQVDGIRYERKVNPRSLKAYRALLLENVSDLRTSEIISPRDARFETMMLGLRMTGGVSEEGFESLHGVSLEACYGPTLRRLSSQGLVAHRNGNWFLTDRGMDIQNTVLVELMD